jgi:hypothetical protein
MPCTSLALPPDTRPRILHLLFNCCCCYVYTLTSLQGPLRCFYPVGFMSPLSLAIRPTYRIAPRPAPRHPPMYRVRARPEMLTQTYATVYVTQLHLTSTTRFTVQKPSVFGLPSVRYRTRIHIHLYTSPSLSLTIPSPSHRT